MRLVFAPVMIAVMMISGGAYAQSAPTVNSASVGKYHFNVEMQIGYPTVTLTNPDGSDAIYDGIGLRGNADIPIYDGAGLDIYATPGVKYLDLRNTANGDSQSEVANVIGPGVGLAVRYSKFWFGAQYYKLWARHYATGVFSSRTEYDFTSIDYFGGIYYQFGRLGVGLNYSMSSAEISKESSGLSVNTPYKESMISVQFTFNTGETLWQIFKGLF